MDSLTQDISVLWLNSWLHAERLTMASPGARLPLSFNVAFERLKETVSKDDARSFASTTMEDVWAAAKDIERQLESRRSLRAFHRIQPFLSGLEQYSKVIEVLCNQTPYLAFIWVGKSSSSSGGSC